MSLTTPILGVAAGAYKTCGIRAMQRGTQSLFGVLVGSQKAAETNLGYQFLL